MSANARMSPDRRFAKLIKEDDFDTALDVARQQVTNGAQLSISIWMRSHRFRAAMVKYLNLLAAEPDISRVPVMIDSSKWSVIEAGLRCVKARAWSIHQHEEGVEEFLEHASAFAGMAPP